MRRLVPGLWLALTLAPAYAGDGFDAAREALVAEAEGLTVAGAAVGRGAQRSRFYGLLEGLAAGTPEQLEALLAHEQVVVRAAGMVCLARLGERAIPTLEARRTSAAKLRFQPVGCGVSEITEGELATRLLLDAGLLEPGAAPRPLIAVPLPADAPKARRLDWARAALRVEAAGLEVTGAAVGFGAQPGRFYLLVRELIAVGDEAVFRALFADEAVVVRAAGMVCLAQTAEPEVAAAALRTRLESETPLRYMPTGCCVDEITEGRLAQELLKNRNVLEVGPEARPLAD